VVEYYILVAAPARGMKIEGNIKLGGFVKLRYQAMEKKFGKGVD